MNELIINEIAKDLNVKVKQVETVLNLLSDGNTIPFIARYRKEATGALDEEEIRKIDEVYQYQVNLSKRKDDVIRLIDEKGLLTDELKNEIMKATKLVEVEDLYRPFKEKKKTKATDAINNGLEPLAKIIMSQPNNLDIDKIASNYLNDKVLTINDAIVGAKYIISEWISDNANYRKWMRSYIYKNGIITTKKKKETTTKFTYNGTVPHTAKSARKSSAQTVTKFAYTGGTSTGDTEEEPEVQSSGTAVLADGTYTAAVTPTHRSTVANILIYLAIALATAAVIALVAGIIKSRKAKQEEAREKQRQEEEQEIEDYDE